MGNAPPEQVDALVVGAGPTGLMLAAEQALAGLAPVVVDMLPEPTGQSRALGFTVRTLEIFEQRGILDRFGELKNLGGVHFAGLKIPVEALGSTHAPATQYPQSRTEEVLAAWATSIGAAVYRGWTATALKQHEDGVTVTVESTDGRSKRVRAPYVLGCDGSRSSIREFVDARTDRTPPSVQMVLADVRDCGLPDNPFGVKHEGGMVMSAPLGDGIDRIIVCQFGETLQESGREVQFADVQRAYEAVVGTALGDGECRWASSFTDAESIVEHYRYGRVFLVGDSARTHLPAGGQGMNVGLHDAVNLGWKIAAAVQGWAPDGLLDSYERERRPVGVALLHNTRAQGQLFLRGPEVDSLRAILDRLIDIPDVAQVLGRSVSGLDVRYDMGIPEAPELVGRRLPPIGLRLLGDRTEPLSCLQQARGVLLVSSFGQGDVQREVLAWRDRVDVVPFVPSGSNPDLPPVDALLVRPDGHVAWVADDGSGRLEDALSRWFGDPTLNDSKEQQDGKHADRRTYV